MRRKFEDDTPESTDRWLLTYADMITLLMAFFIMMYSMSILNLSRFKEAATSIRSGFVGTRSGHGEAAFGTGGGVTQPNGSLVGHGTSRVSWEMLQGLVSYVEETGGKENQEMRVYQDERGIVIAIKSDALLFEPGRAVVRVEAYPLLNRIAETLFELNAPATVEGHTCSILPRGGEFPSNWELSTARATNVIRYLVRKGITPQRLSAAGYASFRPIAPNSTAAGRARNRRVEIVIPDGPRASIQKAHKVARPPRDAGNRQ